jgi:pyruvate/2-oxoglutarate/acetoin dehydrogenase E1 component
MRELQYNKAINEALMQEFERDDNVIMLGEGCQVSSTETTRGLVDKFGKDRVIDTPIAEMAIAGGAIGAAMMGFRPIADIMYSDFLYAAADEILIKAPHWRFIHGGRASLPIVFLGAMGGYRMLGPDHSHCPYSVVLHHPGMKVVVPSTPYDAKGLLKTAIRDNNPVCFFFHKALIGLKEDVPEDDYTIPMGKAVVRCEGSDVTVVAASYMNHLALKAAEKVKDEVSVEVIDPRTLEPFDLDTVLASVSKTGRVVVVDEDTERCGFGGELVAQIVEHAFDELDAPIKRVCAANYPIASGGYERFVLPNLDQVVAAIRYVAQ